MQAEPRLPMWFLLILILQEFILPVQQKFSETSGKKSETIFIFINRIRELLEKQAEKILSSDINLPMQKFLPPQFFVEHLNIRDKNVQRVHALTFHPISGKKLKKYLLKN